MNIQELPLKDRLAALDQGHPAHREYIPALLAALADMPVSAYLTNYPAELERLAAIVRYPLRYMSELTYQDIAIRIQVMYEQRLPAGAEALDILAKPFVEVYRRYWEGRVKNA